MKTIKIGAKPTGRDAGRSVEAWVDGEQVAPVVTERLKRLTIEIPLSLHQKVKLKCVSDGLSIADVVRTRLSQFVEEPQAVSIAR